MKTDFAPADRAGEQAIQSDIYFAANHPIVAGALQADLGPLAVLNSQRQILTVNDACIKSFGVDDAGKVVGLHLGDAIGCIHAHEKVDGCGASRYCPTCGAAVAIAACLAGDEPEERKCAFTLSRIDGRVEHCFRVCAKRIQSRGQYFIILYLQDITEFERWAEIQRTFFNDVSNTISDLKGTVELLRLKNSDESGALLHKIRLISSRLVKEVGIQRELTGCNGNWLSFSARRISVVDLIAEIASVMANHPEAKDKHLTISEIPSRIYLNSDLSLLLRILSNMLINAFEATSPGDEVKFWIEQDPYAIAFCVWNRASIPESVAPRIFQRYFSTKSGTGRGLGTYMMKSFGEDVLGGKATFTSSAQSGTIFRLKLPLAHSSA